MSAKKRVRLNKTSCTASTERVGGSTRWLISIPLCKRQFTVLSNVALSPVLMITMGASGNAEV